MTGQSLVEGGGPFGWQKPPSTIFDEYPMPKDAYNAQPARQDRRSTKKVKKPYDQHEFYVAVIYDAVSGKISKRSSPFLKEYRDNIMAEAGPKFKAIMQTVCLHSHGLPGSSENAQSSRYTRAQASVTQGYPKKRRRSGYDQSIINRKPSEDTMDNDEDDVADDSGCGQVTFPASAREEWEKWFGDAFRAVQQVSCRVIAKEWIKTIHPKKQSTHPYNGKNPRTGQKGDSDSTKPPYWPRDVIHKEPDHIVKDARTKLLVHLLMNTPHQEMSITGDLKANTEITARTLRDALEQKKHDRSMADLAKKFHIIDQIIEIRTRLEQYENGGLNESTLITAPDYSDYNRGNKNEDEDDVSFDGRPTRLHRDQSNEGSDIEEAGCSRQLSPAIPSSTTSPTALSRTGMNMKQLRQDVHTRSKPRRTTADQMRQGHFDYARFRTRIDTMMPTSQTMEVDESAPSSTKASSHTAFRTQLSSPCGEVVPPPSQSFSPHEMQMQMVGRLGMPDTYAGSSFGPQNQPCLLEQPAYRPEVFAFNGFPHGQFMPGMMDPGFGYPTEHGPFPTYEQRGAMSNTEMIHRAYFP